MEMKYFTNVLVKRIDGDAVLYDQGSKQNWKYVHPFKCVPFDALGLQEGHRYNITQVKVAEFKSGGGLYEWIRAEDQNTHKVVKKENKADSLLSF